MGTKKGSRGRRGREGPHPARVPPLDRRTWEGCQTLATQPLVDIQASDPLVGVGVDKGQPSLRVQ